MAAYRLYLTDRERLAMAQDLEHRRVSCRQLMALLERRLQEEHPQLAAGRVGPEHWIDQAPGMPEASCDGDSGPCWRMYEGERGETTSTW